MNQVSVGPFDSLVKCIFLEIAYVGCAEYPTRVNKFFFLPLSVRINIRFSCTISHVGTPQTSQHSHPRSADINQASWLALALVLDCCSLSHGGLRCAGEEPYLIAQHRAGRYNDQTCIHRLAGPGAVTVRSE